MRKKHFSKIVSLALSVITLLSNFTNVFAAEAVNYCYNEDFNSYTTNVEVGSISVSAASGLVKENREKNNKYLALGGLAASAEIPLDALMNNLFISFDLYVPEGNIETSFSVRSEKTEVKLLTIDKKGRLRDNIGKEIGNAGKNKFVKLAVSLDDSYSRYTVYLNEKEVSKGIYVRGDYPAKRIDKLIFASKFSKEDEVFIDNVYAYNAAELVKSKDLMKTVEYNTSEVVIYEDDSYFVEDSTKLLHSTFDTAEEYTNITSYFQTYVSGANTIGWANDSDNGFVKFSQVESGNCFADLYNYPEVPDKSFQFDLKAPSYAPIEFYARDQSGNGVLLMTMGTDGKLMCDGTLVTQIDKKKWTRLAITLDPEKKIIDFYVNGKPVHENFPMPANKLANINLFRIMMRGVGELWLDNYIVYRGSTYCQYDTLFEKENYEIGLYNTHDAAVNEKLLEVNAVDYQVGLMSVDGVIGPCSVMPEFKDDAVWLAKKDALALVGEKNIGTSTELVSLDDVAEEYKKFLTSNPTSTVLVSDTEQFLTDAAIVAINGRFIYDRPEIEDLKKMFKNSGVHPRIYANQAKFDEIKQNFGTEENITNWMNYLIAEADKMLDYSLPEFSQADPVALQRTASPTRERVRTLGLAYKITGETKYADKAWAEIEHFCNYETWGLDTDTLACTSFVETASIGYDWLYDYLTKEQKDLILTKSREYILDDVFLIYHQRRWFDHEWPIIKNNWNASCHQSIMQAATAFFETDPDFYADLIKCALRLYEIMLGGFYPAGAWDEGPGYGLGVLYWVGLAINNLDNNFGTNFGISRTPTFDVAADYFIGISGTEGTNNFNDSDTSAGITQAVNFYLAKIYNKPELASARLFSMYRDNYPPEVYDVLLYDPAMNSKGIDAPLDYYFKKVEVVGMHSSYEDPAAVFVSFHTGNNLSAPWHNHADSGTFVIDMLGERFALDMGAEYYWNEGQADIYRQPREDLITRYSYYMHRPEGHNCFVINPDFSAGQNLFTDDKIEEFVSKPRGAYAISPLTSAYSGYAKQAHRGIMLSDERRSVTIRDEIMLNDGNNEVWWFMHTNPKAKIDVIDNNTATIEINGQKAKMMFYTNGEILELKEMKPTYLTGVDPGGKTDGYYNKESRGKKIALKLNATGNLDIQVKLIPFHDPMANVPMEIKPLSEWSIPDGEIHEIPEAVGMTVNGVDFAGFKERVTQFEVSVDYANQVIPDVALKTGENVVSELVQKAENIKDTTLIKVYHKDRPEQYRMYIITFAVDMNSLETYKHTPVNIAASSEQNPEGLMKNAIDNDLSTRWAADGDGQWVSIDLGESKYVKNIGVAFYNGSQRIAYYKLYTSNDNQNWDLIFDGQSSGLTESIELSPDVNKNVRYIKLEGFGNSTGTWTSVTELAAYGTK